MTARCAPGRSALEALGHSRDEAQMKTDKFEDMDRASMVEVANLFDPAKPVRDNPAYVARIKELMEEYGANTHKGANRKS